MRRSLLSLVIEGAGTKNILFEIEGKPERFDAFYEDTVLPKCDAIVGFNEGTREDDSVRSHRSTSTVFSLAAYRKNEDGSFFGLQGLFKDHLWCSAEDDKILLKLWNRII